MSNVTNADLIVEIAKSKEDGKTTETLGKMMVYIAERYANRSNFINFPYKEEMIQEAITRMIISYPKFNPEKSDNPFAYLAQVARCAFANVQGKERKQQNIAKDVTDYDSCGEDYEH